MSLPEAAFALNVPSPRFLLRQERQVLVARGNASLFGDFYLKVAEFWGSSGGVPRKCQLAGNGSAGCPHPPLEVWLPKVLCYFTAHFQMHLRSFHLEWNPAVTFTYQRVTFLQLFGSFHLRPRRDLCPWESHQSGRYHI